MTNIFEVKMWKIFTNSSKFYIIHLETAPTSFTVLLSNLESLWECRTNKSQVIKDFQDDNQTISITDERILTSFIEIFDNLHTIETFIENYNDRLEIRFEQTFSNITIADVKLSPKFVFRLKFTQLGGDKLKTAIIAPAIQTIFYLENQQKTLLDLIKKKDRELEEYRLEKGEISRADLKTEKFNEEALIPPQNNLFLKVFTEETNREAWKSFCEENGNVATSSLSVDLEPWNQTKRRKIVSGRNKSPKKGIFRKHH